MKTNYAIGMAAASALLAVVIQESRISALSKRLSEMENANPSSVTAVPSEASKPDASAAEKTTTRNLLSQSRVLSNGAAKNSENPDEGDNAMRDGVKKMWDNPAGKAMMNQGLKTAASMMYQDFIDGLNLTKEESDYFMSLLVKGMSDQQGISMEMISGGDQKSMIVEMQKLEKEHQAEVKKFLNSEEDWQAFEEYKNLMPERQQLDGIRATMKEKNLVLDAATEGKLVKAMHRARTNTQGVDLSGPKALEQMANGNLVEGFESNWDNQQELLRAETKEFLSEEQSAAFQNYQTQMKEMQLIQLRMAEKMMPKQPVSKEK